MVEHGSIGLLAGVQLMCGQCEALRGPWIGISDRIRLGQQLTGGRDPLLFLGDPLLFLGRTLLDDGDDGGGERGDEQQTYLVTCNGSPARRAHARITPMVASGSRCSLVPCVVLVNTPSCSPRGSNR
jgi:hypothetical protein